MLKVKLIEGETNLCPLSDCYDELTFEVQQLRTKIDNLKEEFGKEMEIQVNILREKLLSNKKENTKLILAKKYGIVNKSRRAKTEAIAKIAK